MRFPPVTELALLGIVDAGVPNRERIVLRPLEAVNLAQFGMLLGVGERDTGTIPLADDFFWFGERIVEPPSWIVLYTGEGQFRETHMVDSGQKVYVFHWGKLHTVFDIEGMLPLLVRFDAVVTGAPARPINSLPPKTA